MQFLPNTETTHNCFAACGCKDNTRTAQKLKAQWHLTIWARKGNLEFILEFSGLYHYHLKEGRKPKYSGKNPDDLFIRRLKPV
jgi:hypothetical protein